MYIETTDSISFLPSSAIKGLGLTEIPLSNHLINFDVIAARHPSYSDDAL
jgi:hypothetical protein